VEGLRAASLADLPRSVERAAGGEEASLGTEARAPPWSRAQKLAPPALRALEPTEQLEQQVRL